MIYFLVGLLVFSGSAVQIIDFAAPLKQAHASSHGNIQTAGFAQHGWRLVRGWTSAAL
jgi:hypothetical protein